MANHSDADFEVDSIANRASGGWTQWPEMGGGIKRSFSWNGFAENRRHRMGSPEFYHIAQEEVPGRDLSRNSPLSVLHDEVDYLSSPSAVSPDGSGSIISDCTLDSLQEAQSNASPSKSIVSRQSDDIFAEDGDSISFSSPDQGPNGSKRSADLFSSMDVAYDTQSADLFSDCESNADFTQLGTASPDLFGESDSSRAESVVDGEQNDAIIDLTQDDGDLPAQVRNECDESGQHKNEEDVSGDENEIVPLAIVTQSREASNISQEVTAVGDDGDLIPMSQQSQLVIANEHLRMHSDPNILLERLLGARYMVNAPNTAPIPDHLNDGTTTIFFGDDASGPEIDGKAKEILRKIEHLVVDTLTKLSEGKRMEFSVRNRTDWSNCVFEDEVFTLMPLSQAKCRRVRSTYSLSLIFYLLSEIYEMISLKRTCTLRELYYNDTNITEKQENVNEALKLICCKLEVPPWQLGVMSSVKGLLAGRMQIFMPDDVVIDCSLHADGMLLPSNTAGIERMTTDAKYVLLVEKDTVFKKLVQKDISKHFGTEFVLITGKGYPDTHTRLMLKKIWESHKLPIYALTDADPHGIEIMLTYRHGSRAMSNVSDALAVPSIRWIGILPSDIQKFGIRSIPMTDQDRRKLENLMNRPGLSDAVYSELLCLQRNDVKAEIEGLSGSSSEYLIDVYLRYQFENKIAI